LPSEFLFLADLPAVTGGRTDTHALALLGAPIGYTDQNEKMPPPVGIISAPICRDCVVLATVGGQILVSMSGEPLYPAGQIVNIDNDIVRLEILHRTVIALTNEYPWRVFWESGKIGKQIDTLKIHNLALALDYHAVVQRAGRIWHATTAGFAEVSDQSATTDGDF